MQPLVLAHRNVVWRLKEFMNSDGWQSSKYNIITRFPPQSEVTAFQVPVLATQIIAGTDYDVQISSEPNVLCTFVIDIFASGNVQMDAILGTLLKNLKDAKEYTFYDMTSVEPSTVGDYTGLSSLGIMQLERPVFRKLDVVDYIEDSRFFYHGFLSVNARLPYV